jgi:hypothetical protein
MGESEKKVDESWKERIEKEREDAHREEEKDTAQRAQATQTEFPKVEANFTTLIAELAMQASFFMGEIADPESKEPVEDLNRAKYLIDELGVLEEKTKGNLTPQEEQALKNVLFDLRMKYVKKAPGS